MATVRFFASLKEMAGKDSLEVPLAEPVSVKRFIDDLASALPDLVCLFKDKHVSVAVNQETAGEETLVREGDEVALMPPFAGGAANLRLTPWTRIQAEDFSVDEEVARIKTASSCIGGIAVFLGTARDFSKGHKVKRLSYEHYAGMAERKLGEVRDQAIKQFDFIEATIIHRTGEIPTGGNIVLTLVAAEHRGEAFRACRWCIDELKATTPIWKKEITPEGELWVEDRP